jgi:sigma-B regulation protein RsbU (phosphoserine phosphatase)
VRTYEESRVADVTAPHLAHLHAVVVDLGQRTLSLDPSVDIPDEAVRLVASALSVDYANVMELLPGGERLLLRAGVGWKEGLVGRATVAAADSQPGYTVRSDRPVIVEDTAAEKRFVPLPRLLGEHLASAMSVVISTREGPYGTLGVHTRHWRTFTGDEVGFLQTAANVLGAAIERRRAEDRLQELRALNAELERRVAARTAELDEAREREMNIGFRIQQMLLLDEPPRDVPELRAAAQSVPAHWIGGDFYEFFRHDSRRLDLIVADVMGKGVGAALLGAATKSHFLKALCHLMPSLAAGALPEPKDVVTRAHADLARQLIELESFVTLCYARFDMEKRNVHLVDCGHTGVLHLRAGRDRCELLHGQNLPLGVRQGEVYDQVSVPLEPDDVLLFYSDGVTEARNPAGELFGTDRLAEFIRRNADLEPDALVQAVRDATIAFAESPVLRDDLTCVAVKVAEARASGAHSEIEIRSDLKDLRRAREFVRAFCHNLTGPMLDENDIAEFELAVNEAASNVMKHAYHGRAGQPIAITADASRDRVSIRLSHLGESFDPAPDAPPAFERSRESGFGIFLITRSVDSVRYERDELGRSCICLDKLRKA